MPTSQESIPMPSPSPSARERLREFLDARRRAKSPVEDLEQFERELHALFAAAEAEAVADELALFDVDLPAIEIDGVGHRRVLRCEAEYIIGSTTSTAIWGSITDCRISSPRRGARSSRASRVASRRGARTASTTALPSARSPAST